uniref:protein NODULATION SIGNALING PATHWAY 2-like n=1 Tax=Erigeron canadensis TaxID=72917 RepID=UPI001CB8C8D1|nr:protein NODULATION SIGNALING PATHWAY 2-like [Erigeron canadensis]
MELSELTTSWPTHSYFRSNLDPYDPKMMNGYDSNCYDSSIITMTTPENSSISSVNFSMVCDDSSYGHEDIHNPPLVNMEGIDDVCKWLYDDRNGHGTDEASVCVVEDDAMENDSQTGIKNLLMAYADAKGMEHEELAKVIAKCLSEKANPIGSPLERVTFNLFQQEEHEEEAYLKQESVRNFNQAFRAFYDIFPYGKFAHLMAGSAIIEAVPTHVVSIVIIDFDLCEGSQWPPVIEAMARMKKSLTIISIKLDQDQNSRFEETKKHLCNFARSLGLNLKVQEMDMAQIFNKMVGREFVAFNCMVGLPHMRSSRNKTQVMSFLRMAKRVLAKNEGIITFGDGEGYENTRNSSDFSSFFNKFLARYKALYESMEWGFPSYLSEARITMETLFLAPFVSSNSWFQKWEEQREDMAFDMNLHTGYGLKGQRMSQESRNEARELVKAGETPYKIRIKGDDENEMVLEWRGTSLVRVSSWK